MFLCHVHSGVDMNEVFADEAFVRSLVGDDVTLTQQDLTVLSSVSLDSGNVRTFFVKHFLTSTILSACNRVLRYR